MNTPMNIENWKPKNFTVTDELVSKTYVKMTMVKPEEGLPVSRWQLALLVVIVLLNVLTPLVLATQNQTQPDAVVNQFISTYQLEVPTIYNGLPTSEGTN